MGGGRDGRKAGRKGRGKRKEGEREGGGRGDLLQGLRGDRRPWPRTSNSRMLSEIACWCVPLALWSYHSRTYWVHPSVRLGWAESKNVASSPAGFRKRTLVHLRVKRHDRLIYYFKAGAGAFLSCLIALQYPAISPLVRGHKGPFKRTLRCALRQ